MFPHALAKDTGRCVRRFQTAGFRATGLALIASLLPLLAGVGCCGPMACGPIGCGNLCGMNSCDGPLLALGGGCGHSSCGGACGNSGCSSCQNGCGELYVDEWINTPPLVTIVIAAAIITDKAAKLADDPQRIC